MDEQAKTIRVACIGLGPRGLGQMKELLNVPGVGVCAVCDQCEDRALEGAAAVEERTAQRPAIYTDYRRLLKKEGESLDAVLCCTTWITHSRIAVDAMRAGCHVAAEVGGAASMGECWELVRASEETGKFCMLLENCCYDRNEMALFHMQRQGLFGEVVHCEGGYRHDLREEIAFGRENRHGRLANFIHRNGELYPTHQLGPIAKLLGINRGNRFLTVSSIAGKARGLHEYIQTQPRLEYLKNQVFNEGDVVDTTITCANGETIHLVHDCSLPRPYSRGYALQGTRGIYQEAPFGNAIFIEGLLGKKEGWDHSWEKFDDHREKFEHPLWARYLDEGVHFGGHGGMDFLVLSAFVDAVLCGATPPIDVYDTAAWMSVTALSEQSVALGGAPVPVPDFTNGRWIDREPFRRGIYCLEDVCGECFLESNLKN
ncbi:MAG: Gfo/Idh/MocA family oxidoreductase [Oscillospiraceae bacterium]|jgi:predicted dehydrogenase|nr:Gfo/Idh/MocA family oxidoreductase [Oscillospiraceae bacterium]